MLLFVSFYGCSKEQEVKEAENTLLTENMTDGQSIHKDSSDVLLHEGENAYRSSNIIKREVKTSDEPLLLEQGVWSLEALLQYNPMMVLQFRMEGHGGFIASLFLFEDSISMDNESVPNKFTDLNIEFHDDLLKISGVEILYKNKADWQDEIDGDSSSFIILISRELVINLLLNSDEPVEGMQLYCDFNKDEGLYRVTRIELD